MKKKVKTLEELQNAAFEKKAVKSEKRGMCFERPIPAAVILNMAGTTILRLFQDGLYVYEKPKRGKGWGQRRRQG